MKNILAYILLFVSLLSCKDEEVKNEFDVQLEVEQRNESVRVKNLLIGSFNYDLDFGDGTKITGQYVSEEFPYLNKGEPHVYNQDGSYVIRLTAYNVKHGAKTISKEITIDYHANKNTEPVSKYKISLLNKGNGVIELSDSSVYNFSNLQTNLYSESSSYRTKMPNPVFELDLSGKYNLSGSIDTTVQVTVSPERELGFFKGEWFGEKIDITENFSRQNGTIYYRPLEENINYLVNVVRINKNLETGRLFLVNKAVRSDSLSTNKMKYEQIKSRLKVGVENPENWILDLTYYPYVSSLSHKIEIIEVREAPQRKIIPEMMDKCFWVTTKIQADFGAAGKIDGILKTRYLIYENVVY